jgi:hypothetical protein
MTTTMIAAAIQPRDVLTHEHRACVVETVMKFGDSIQLLCTSGNMVTATPTKQFRVTRRFDPCLTCRGTGWICVQCGKPGDKCSCPDLVTQDAIDCQDCQGTGEVE